ncbi:unnamed protein product [Cuscuta epithymum]|uniref:Uncharacterized protein n=1 Tax=Cuscuta epithymum TaxID=186058 RepID=A0AAV0C655_9ASTE|nr:unnamed protein product [Cuscuta epithymum]
MAIKLCGGIIFERGGIAEAAAYVRNEDPARGLVRPAPFPARTQPGINPLQARKHFRARQGPQQTLTRRPRELDVPPPGRLSSRLRLLVLRIRQPVEHREEDGEGGGHEEEGSAADRGGVGGGRRDEQQQRGAEVPALRDGQDAAVADGADGAEDAVQRVRGEVQVGAAGAGVPAGGEPDVHADEALEFAPEGSGDPAAEGASPGPAPATVHPSEDDV